MSLAEAMAPVEVHNFNIVMNNTWGHLAPEPREKYSGVIIFCQTECGLLSVIRSDIKGLHANPWTHQHMSDLAGEKATEAGEIYKFTGYYMVYKNGKPTFSGKIERLKL